MIKKGYQAPSERQFVVRKPTPAAWVWKVKDSVSRIDMKSYMKLTTDETGPPHTDMLRYDLCFCNPGNPDQVVFPVFKTSNGHTTRSITLERWHSFGMRLDRFGMSTVNEVKNWVSYKATSNGELIPVTLEEYMEREKAKIVAWR